MAQLRAPFLLAAALVAALPGALALKSNWKSREVQQEVNIPTGLMLALRHNHQSCSRPPVINAHPKKSIASNNVTAVLAKLPRKRINHEQNKMKKSYRDMLVTKKGVDFSGSWVISKIEGDMDKMLKKMGLGALERQAARMFSYGVGHVNEKIVQHDDDFVATVKTELGTEELHYRVGGEITQKNAMKKKKVETVTCQSEWADNEKNELVINSSSSNGKALPQLRRSLVGDNMVVKMILDDTTVSVIYKRK